MQIVHQHVAIPVIINVTQAVVYPVVPTVQTLVGLAAQMIVVHPVIILVVAVVQIHVDQHAQAVAKDVALAVVEVVRDVAIVAALMVVKEVAIINV